MSAPRRDRLGDVRRQHRTQYAYMYDYEPTTVKKKTKKKKTAWLRYDLVLIGRFPKSGSSAKFKHLRAKRTSLGPLLTARERSLIRADLAATMKPWSEV